MSFWAFLIRFGLVDRRKLKIQQAVSLNPTTVIIWLGNNDALLPVLFGGQPTPIDPFTDAYTRVLSALS